MTKSGLHGFRYAIDNECYTLGDRFDADRFKRAVIRIKDVHGIEDCIFVGCPDVPFYPRATLHRFYVWQPWLAELGFPVALIAQDGLENLNIPWGLLDALFIGGSTEWKLGESVAKLIREAKRRGKWTHIGRVNSTRRASRLREHPDSIDGTAWALHPQEYALQWQRWLDAGRPSFIGTLC